MQLPFSLPDWVPAWVGFAAVVAGALFVLAFLAMPFSVFGLKGRLDGVEARLDEIQREIRSLALRLPERGRTELVEYDDEPARAWREPAVRARPPIPPRTSELDRPAPPPGRTVRPGRSEPRFDPG